MNENCALLPVQLSGRCIRALANYAPRRQNVQYPRERCAAVLVALFVGRKGDLYVLLSRYATHTGQDQASHQLTSFRRASTLRTYRGDTALPGGKVDEKDKNAEETAVSVLRRHQDHVSSLA